jgi:recombination protein RecR
MNSHESLDRLVSALGRLPGIGRRSAERMAVKLVQDSGSLLKELKNALADAERNVAVCSLCGSVTVVQENPCRLCADGGRDGGVVCVVEDPGDIAIIERSGGFRGRYHALMGKLSPMRGEGLADLRIKALLDRIAKEKFTEVILALSTDVEGDSTASYLAELFAGRNIRLTRLAFGLPAGSRIMYSDPVTLSRAMQGRQPA